MPQYEPSTTLGHEEILAAARDLFAEAGYDAVSMQAIAGRAGTSKANLFHHFGSKESLYLAVMRAACGEFSSAADAIADAGGDHGRRVSGFLRADMDTMRADPERTHLILREVLESGPGRGRALAAEVFDEHFRQVVELVRGGQAAGVFADDIPPGLAAVTMIAAGCFVFQSRHVLRHLDGVDFVDDPERYARLVSRVLLDGMRHPPSDASTAPEDRS